MPKIYSLIVLILLILNSAMFIKHFFIQYTTYQSNKNTRETSNKTIDTIDDISASIAQLRIQLQIIKTTNDLRYRVDNKENSISEHIDELDTSFATLNKLVNDALIGNWTNNKFESSYVLQKRYPDVLFNSPLNESI